MLLLPSTLAESEEILTSAMISDLIHMYEDYLPAPGSIDTELHGWGMKWKDFDYAATFGTPAKVLAVIDSNFVPNIETLCKIACTLAVTSAECERSISRLRYLKTYLRSTMTKERLNGLALFCTLTEIFHAMLSMSFKSLHRETQGGCVCNDTVFSFVKFNVYMLLCMFAKHDWF